MDEVIHFAVNLSKRTGFKIETNDEIEKIIVTVRDGNGSTLELLTPTHARAAAEALIHAAKVAEKVGNEDRNNTDGDEK